ncbi:LITAF-like zinc ribbon domain-containing protein [Paraphoma chrysanthemicola]|nr:LITAF-like zinc ribbon domain-containing protein [Paraphoma chrysanthemicola]
MEKTGVPMQQYPQSPDVTGQPQPPVYHQDPNAAQYQQTQQPMYAQQPPQQYAGSPPPQMHPQGAYMSPQATGQVQQPGMPPQQPGMPPQQQSGTVYQNATPIASLGRGPAPADCPACGQRAMTNVAFETGNTTHAWAAGLCCFCCLGCIPYVMNSLKDVQHKCGRCGVLLATWHRSGTTEVHIHS